MNKIAAMDLLRTQGWLASTPGSFREQVLSHCDLLRVAGGQPVYNSGDDVGGLYGVVSGRVGLHLTGADGAPTLTHISQPGMWLGDAGAIRNARRLISITAMADTELLRLSRASMVRISGDDPIAWLHFAQLASANSVLLLQTIAMLRREDPVERVAAMLLHLSKDGSGRRAKAPGSQTELAAMTSLSRSTVSTALAELVRRKWLRTGYRSIEILDHDAIENFLGPSDFGVDEGAA